MAEMTWEHAGEAREALNAIVTDPEHGVAALSSPRTMSNLLKDLLPDAPREKNLLVAAAEAGLADTLREHVTQGMDAGTAIRLTASSFSASTALTPDACSWVTGEIAMALGIREPDDHGRPGGMPPGSYPIGDVRTEAGQAGGSHPSGQASYATAGYPPPPGGYSPVPMPVPVQAPGVGSAPGQGFQRAPGQGPMPGYQPVPLAGQARKNNSLAVTSLVLGLLQFVGWIIFLLPGLIVAILAIVFGFVSMRQISRSGEGGRGMAVTGAVLGLLGIIVVTVLIIVGVAAVSTQN